MKNKIGLFAAGAAVIGSLFVSGTAFAQTPQGGHGWGPGGHPPGVFGTVSAVSGSTLTIESKGLGQNATQTTYSVDASGATVTKNGSASSVGDIAVGDRVMVQGTVNGTDVTATTVRDGMGMGRGPGMGMKGKPGSALAGVQGNGQPVVGGSVTAISGNTLTITNQSNVTYTVDASSAKIVKSGATSTISAIAAGDRVVVQGTVNGSAVTASSVIDQGAAPSGNASSSITQPAPHGGFMGFLGSVGGFFGHLFGF